MKRKSQSTSNTHGDQFFINLSSSVTGRQLYEQERKNEINTEAAKRRKDADTDGGHAGFYQVVLKEMWEDEEDQQAYEKRAEEVESDIPRCAFLDLSYGYDLTRPGHLRNQKEFMKAAWFALKTLCQNGKLGPAEMMLFFAFRDEHGDLDSGV